MRVAGERNAVNDTNAFLRGTCGADGLLVAPISAMLLHDDCHSIDSPSVGPICSA